MFLCFIYQIISLSSVHFVSYFIYLSWAIHESLHSFIYWSFFCVIFIIVILYVAIVRLFYFFIISPTLTFQNSRRIGKQGRWVVLESVTWTQEQRPLTWQASEYNLQGYLNSTEGTSSNSVRIGNGGSSSFIGLFFGWKDCSCHFLFRTRAWSS